LERYIALARLTFTPFCQDSLVFQKPNRSVLLCGGALSCPRFFLCGLSPDSRLTPVDPHATAAQLLSNGVRRAMHHAGDFIRGVTGE
jgi:hypothetical protein